MTKKDTTLGSNLDSLAYSHHEPPNLTVLPPTTEKIEHSSISEHLKAATKAIAEAAKLIQDKNMVGEPLPMDVQNQTFALSTSMMALQAASVNSRF